MVAWPINTMGGVTPRTDRRLVGDNAAVEAVNCDLSSGALDSLTAPTFIIDLNGTRPPPIEKAYHFPATATTAELWVPLPSKFSSVVRSPLANDTQNRVYWTNPGDKYPHWSTYAMIAAHTPPYDLGIPIPTGKPVISSVMGGDTTIPAVARSYLYTYFNAYGEESGPSPASDVVDGPSDATWTITNLPTAAPINPVGANYPPVTGFRLYRTITSNQTGTQFYEIQDFTFPSSGMFVDTINDDVVVLHPILITSSWDNPPDYLDGLVSLPGGFFGGFTGNTIHFSEPNRPHTWPPGYDQSVHYEIVSIVVWQQYLMVLTKGYPSVGSGNAPANFILVQSQVPEPCVARGSVIVDLQAVYYASQNGLVQLTGYGLEIITLLLVDKKQWITRYKAENIVACRHRSMFLAINATGAGFLIDYAEKRIGFIDINTFNNAVSVWNDENTGDSYIMAGGIVYLWDDAHSTWPLTYRWRTRQFFTPEPISLGACQITLDKEIYDVFSHPTPPLDNGVPTLVLPAGINAVFNLYAGPKRTKVMTRNLTKQQEIFRLPKGFKAFEYEAEIVSRVRCASIQLATTLPELKRV